jgi:hypothetical protein
VIRARIRHDVVGLKLVDDVAAAGRMEAERQRPLEWRTRRPALQPLQFCPRIGTRNARQGFKRISRDALGFGRRNAAGAQGLAVEVEVRKIVECHP